MRKINLVVALLLVSFWFILAPQRNFALADNDLGSSTKSTPSAVIEYDLAYPGMLPDNPLYKLKLLRDKMSLFFISDPAKKIDFYLLQTDKGILASAILVDENKIDLAQETALKAEHNYTLLTQQLYRLPEKPDAKFFQRLKTASLKHQEVLESLIKRVPPEKQKTFKEVLYFSKLNLKSVEDYQKQKHYLNND